MENRPAFADHLLTTPNEVVVHWFAPEPHGLYRVGRGDDDMYYVTRDTTPMFCVSAQFQEDAEARAGEAIEAYFTLSRKEGLMEGARTLWKEAEHHRELARESRKVLDIQIHELAAALLSSWGNGLEIQANNPSPTPNEVRS